ncbi:Hypothetical protein SSCIU_02572 [Mammaliicoccus sciuri]|nr:Hypothetical protein SSCIU_02572 [Mammaliicoccus sciuri]
MQVRRDKQHSGAQYLSRLVKQDK